MVKFRRFQGFLANAMHISKIISPEYDTINTKEARTMADSNPYSFLRVNKPEINLPTETDPYSDVVYTTGKDMLQHFIQQEYLVRDSEKTMYIYQQITKDGQHKQQGLIGLTSIEDYEQNRIKRHEHTLAKKEQDRTKLTTSQNANIGPVFLTFKENQAAIKAQIALITEQQEPYGDVVSEDGVRHTLWKCPVDQAIKFEKEFEKVTCLYVADGHHRTAAAYNLGKMRREEALAKGQKVTGEEPFNYFMSICYPADNLLIMDYNRVIKNLKGLDSATFLKKLEEICDISKLESSTSPDKKGKFSLLLDSDWYSLTPKQKQSGIDSQILTDTVLSPVLGIHDLKNDSSIDFVGGIRGLAELERRCKDDCKAAIALYPVSIEELMAVADAGQIMPPKSTWFEPKPRAGFVIRLFEEEEESKEVGYQTATLGAGCFWCVEAVLIQLPGVIKISSGFMGGKTKNPTYEQICYGNTGHAEVVQVTYDPKIITFAQLLTWFWKLHDPTTLNKQGNDEGTQYRSVIFTHSEEQRQIALNQVKEMQLKFKNQIVTEISPAQTYYEADEEHQDYYFQNKEQGYCAYVITPKLKYLGLKF